MLENSQNQQEQVPPFAPSASELPALVRVQNSIGNEQSIPMDPRVKLLQWSVVNGRLSIVSMTGDFTGLGFVDSRELDEDSDLAIKQLQAFQMLGESQTDEVFAQFQLAIESGHNPPRVELKLSLGNDVFWVEQETLIQESPNGKPRIFSYWHDLTSQKLAESQSRILTQVFDSIPSWIFLKNKDLQYEMVNESYASVYGVTPEDCLGKNSHYLGVPKEMAEVFWADDREVFESGTPKHILCEPISINDEHRFLQTLKTPITVAETGQELLVGFCHDITYMKQIEEQIGIELRHNKTLNDINQILRTVHAPAQALEQVCKLLTGVVGLEVNVQGSGGGQHESSISNTCLYSTPIVFDDVEFALLNTAKPNSVMVLEGSEISVENKTTL